MRGRRKLLWVATISTNQLDIYLLETPRNWKTAYHDAMVASKYLSTLLIGIFQSYPNWTTRQLMILRS